MISRGKEFRQQLEERVLIGDGAMGSRLYELGMPLSMSYDHLNIARPELIQQVHREYLDAGADVIETNTFSANRPKLERYGLEGQLVEINRRGVNLAREVAGQKAFVAASVGPLPGAGGDANIEELSETQAREIFREQIAALVEANPDVLLLETFTDIKQIGWAMAEAKACCDLPVIAQMTFPDGQHAPDGTDAYEAIESLHRAGADVIGTNCGQGVSKVLRVIEYLGQRTQAKLSAFANAGLPQQVGGRFLYLATASYIADSAERMVQAGANLIGGCCGTTAADIAAIAQRIKGARPAPRTIVTVKSPISVTPTAPPRTIPSYLADLKKKTVILVELDPPKTTDVQHLIRDARALKIAGADAMTLGDSPLATLRMNSLIAGPLVEREVEIPVICHLACRDRNLIGTQSLLLGADALGVRSVLALTGDPAKLGDHPAATSVYDLNSFKLIELLSQMNAGRNHAGQSIGRPTRFHIGVAFNPNVRNIDVETKRLKRKVENGATFALTQAVFDVQTMQRACAAAKEIGIPIFAGIYPLLSSRNAEYLHNEFPGITICDDVRKRMADAGPSKEKMVAEGIAIAKELADEFRECADGIYLIPPLNKAAIAVELIRYVRQREAVKN